MSALASLNLSLATWFLTLTASKTPRSRVLNKFMRKAIGNFGPTLIILGMSALVMHPSLAFLHIETLKVPSTFSLGLHNRPWLVDLRAVPVSLRLLSALPALLLNMLFYLDQNISVRAGFNTGLKKGTAYHLDMLVLGACVGGLSLCGLPWTCAATVQTLNHIRALSTVEIDPLSGKEKFSSIIETRVTGFLVHAAILATLLLLPSMRFIPMYRSLLFYSLLFSFYVISLLYRPVISGIFLFLGQKLTADNLYIERVSQLLDEKKLLPPASVFRQVKGRKGVVTSYLAIQTVLLGLIWYLKQHRTLSIFFPGVVGLLMGTRHILIPKIFSARDLAILDPEETD